MFAKSIIDSDAFIEMPMSARLLYYDLSMRADDDGFVNSPKKIMKFVGATNDDMNILIARKFVLAFENGVIVIKHWRIHNYIKTDRYKETNYKEQKALLTLDENKAYKMIAEPQWNQNGSTLDTQVRLEIELGKDRDNISTSGTTKKKFVKPSPGEVNDYFIERGSTTDEADRFYDYYESNGWSVGKGKMKDWKAAVRNWLRNDYRKQTKKLPNFSYNKPRVEKSIEISAEQRAYLDSLDD